MSENIGAGKGVELLGHIIVRFNLDGVLVEADAARLGKFLRSVSQFISGCAEKCTLFERETI